QGWGPIPLEKVEVRDDLRFSCLSCGACCSIRYRVQLQDRDAEVLESLDLQKIGITYEDVVQEIWQRNRFGDMEVRRYLKRDDTRCVFLGEDRLCEIHRHFGYDKKPFACRTYPFQPVLTPDGGAVMLFRPECSSQHLTMTSGALVSERKAEIWKEIELGFRRAQGIREEFLLSDGHTISWQDYKPMEQRWLDVTRAEGWRAGLEAIGGSLFDTPLESPKPLRAVMIKLSQNAMTAAEAIQHNFRLMVP